MIPSKNVSVKNFKTLITSNMVLVHYIEQLQLQFIRLLFKAIPNILFVFR